MKKRLLPLIITCSIFLVLTSCLLQRTDLAIGVGLIPYPPKSKVSIKVMSDQSIEPLYSRVFEADTRYNPLYSGNYVYATSLPLSSTLTVQATVDDGILQKTKTAVYKLSEAGLSYYFEAQIDLTDGGFKIICYISGATKPCEQP